MSFCACCIITGADISRIAAQLHRGAEDSIGVSLSAFAVGAFIAEASIPIPWQQLAQ